MAVEADVDEAGELADHLGRVVEDHGLPGPRFGMVFPAPTSSPCPSSIRNCAGWSISTSAWASAIRT
ncbi:MAG: hypothetical protein R2713_09965 [Ilumatobacteraceae bacterium]